MEELEKKIEEIGRKYCYYPEQTQELLELFKEERENEREKTINDLRKFFRDWDVNETLEDLFEKLNHTDRKDKGGK